MARVPSPMELPTLTLKPGASLAPTETGKTQLISLQALPPETPIRRKNSQTCSQQPSILATDQLTTKLSLLVVGEPKVTGKMSTVMKSLTTLAVTRWTPTPRDRIN